MCISTKMTVYREKTVMKLNICLFFIKDDELLEKYNEIWGKVKDSLKKSLIVNQYTVKNI